MLPIPFLFNITGVPTSATYSYPSTLSFSYADPNGYSAATIANVVLNSENKSYWTVYSIGDDTRILSGTGSALTSLTTGLGVVSGDCCGFDSTDNFYITGSDNYPNNTILKKFNSSGTLQWSLTHSGAFGSGDTTGCLTIDSSDNIFVAGPVVGTVSVKKYNTSGTVLSSYSTGNSTLSICSDVNYVYFLSESTLRRTNFNFGSASTISGLSRAYWVDVDNSGNIYISCTHSHLIKYNSSLVLQWSKVITGSTIGLLQSGMVVDRTTGTTYKSGVGETIGSETVVVVDTNGNIIGNIPIGKRPFALTYKNGSLWTGVGVGSNIELRKYS